MIHVNHPALRQFGNWLCGAEVGNNDGWVHHMSPAERFRCVNCVACLKHQILDCQMRADRETTETSTGCEQAVERVCRETLAELALEVAS